MNSRTAARAKKQNSTIFSPVFGKKVSNQTFTPESANEAHDVSNPEFGHNFGDVQVESPSFKQYCPLSLSSPAYCPFGGACHTCPARVQTKLKIGQPGDQYEQEADSVAEKVMRMPDPRVQREACPSCNENDEEELIQNKPVAGLITPLVQRQVEEEEEEEKVFQPKAPGQTPEVTSKVQMDINNLRGTGKPLPESERPFFEQRFGYDFSQVRVHSGAQAARLTRAVNARAFTVGRDVVFGVDQYAPKTNKGRRLLSHELTHVVQQNKGTLQTKQIRGQTRNCYQGKTERTSAWQLGHGLLSIQRQTSFDNILFNQSTDLIGKDDEVLDGDSPVSSTVDIGEISDAQKNADESEDLIIAKAWVQLKEGSKTKKPSSKQAKKRPTITRIDINLSSQRMKLTWSDGNKSKLITVSTGKGLRKNWKSPNSRSNPCKDPNTSGSNCTPVGTFTTGRKGGANFKNAKGDAISWYVELEGKGATGRGIGIHDSQRVTGRPASHGCVRVDDPTAKLINKNVTNKTVVVISGNAPIRKKKPAKKPSSKKSGSKQTRVHKVVTGDTLNTIA